MTKFEILKMITNYSVYLNYKVFTPATNYKPKSKMSSADSTFAQQMEQITPDTVVINNEYERLIKTKMQPNDESELEFINELNKSNKLSVHNYRKLPNGDVVYLVKDSNPNGYVSDLYVRHQDKSILLSEGPTCSRVAVSQIEAVDDMLKITTTRLPNVERVGSQIPANPLLGGRRAESKLHIIDNFKNVDSDNGNDALKQNLSNWLNSAGPDYRVLELPYEPKYNSFGSYTTFQNVILPGCNGVSLRIFHNDSMLIYSTNQIPNCIDDRINHGSPSYGEIMESALQGMKLEQFIPNTHTAHFRIMMMKTESGHIYKDDKAHEGDNINSKTIHVYYVFSSQMDDNGKTHYYYDNEMVNKLTLDTPNNEVVMKAGPNKPLAKQEVIRRMNDNTESHVLEYIADDTNFRLANRRHTFRSELMSGAWVGGDYVFPLLASILSRFAYTEELPFPSIRTTDDIMESYRFTNIFKGLKTCSEYVKYMERLVYLVDILAEEMNPVFRKDFIYGIGNYMTSIQILSYVRCCYNPENKSKWFKAIEEKLKAKYNKPNSKVDVEAMLSIVDMILNATKIETEATKLQSKFSMLNVGAKPSATALLILNSPAIYVNHGMLVKFGRDLQDILVENKNLNTIWENNGISTVTYFINHLRPKSKVVKK